MFAGLTSTPAWRDLPPGPPHHPSRAGDVGLFGMTVFLISLAVFFLAVLLMHLMMRWHAVSWPPPGVPALPGAMWLSTLLLVGTSVVLHLGLSAVRRGDGRRMRLWLRSGAGLGTAFLLCQMWCWWVFFQHEFAPEAWRYAAFFVVFTAIHALHVVGGLPPLWIVLRNSLARRYSPCRYSGVRHCVMYWHFLDAVWLVIFASLILPG